VIAASSRIHCSPYRKTNTPIFRTAAEGLISCAIGLGAPLDKSAFQISSRITPATAIEMPRDLGGHFNFKSGQRSGPRTKTLC
jgi:hypothetical protein